MVYGVGPVFWVWTGSFLLWLRNGSTSNHHSSTSSTIPVNQPHHLCVPAESSRVRERCIIIGCLPVPWVCLLCHYQHARCARSVPACQRVIQMSWKPRRCATVPDGSSSFTRLYSWFGLSVCDDIWQFYSFMWWPIGCVCHH